MRKIIALGALLATPALATPANNQWHAKARDLLKHAIEVLTVKGRGHVPELARWFGEQFKAAGWADSDIKVVSYEGAPGDQTAALVVRWPGSGKAKPIMLMAHLDVVEAKRDDWTTDPFVFVEKDGYYYGRGTTDIKQGAVAVTTALLELKANGFKPKRDIIVLFTGDEETAGNGAQLAATKWADFKGVEYGLNADGGGGGFRPDGTPLGFSIDTAEKTYADYTFSVRDSGGHSSKPKPFNPITELSSALVRLGAYRFEPALNETSRAYFQERQKSEKGPLGDAMRAWLANPNDGRAADVIEADPGEVGLTRTRCVATMLNGGHAPNALPQLAQATVNCRILPGVTPDAIRDELQKIAGDKVQVTRLDQNATSFASPLRPDIMKTYTDSIHAMFPNAPVIPTMAAGASDARPFRVAGVPVYGVDGSWGLVPDDMRAHGRDERLPVKALDDDVDHWVRMITTVAK
ncbi:M20/M25/M40 family metallo-hydrolase [Sphingomonas tabacisoli]|uniref:M20/M25/M40 family metallo-hydrolase n=1 Tax=Sphingomonas tabacisoli TaxID=2249466 RepID=A0ABW4I4P1_9SPHN